VWDWQRQASVVLSGHTDAVNDAVFSPDGRYVVTASRDHTAWVWDWQHRIGTVLAGHTESVNSAAFSTDGHYVVTASSDQTARVWDWHTDTTIAVLRENTAAVTSAAFIGNGDPSYIVAASNDGTAQIYRCDGCAPLPHLRALASLHVVRRLSAEERGQFLLGAQQQ
jgi:WD40 repeat protein